MQANDIETVADALDYMEETPGQKYLRKEGAEMVIEPFTTQYGTSENAGGMARGISDRAGDSRGLLTVSDDTLVCTVEDISSTLCYHLGLNVSEADMVGAGFQADTRHDENVETLREFVED